jgi:hypothetical protein
MIKVPDTLTTEEMNALRSIAALDGQVKVPPPVRGRLEFYGLIEETATGWRPTRLGQDRLAVAARSAATH